MPPDDEWITEEALALALNVDRSHVRAKRPYLLAGEVDRKNGAVLWQRSAAQRVAAEMGLMFADAPPAAAVPINDVIETLAVVSPALNRNIVNAQRANGEMACVRVTDNRKFVPRLGNGQPMTLRAQKSAAGNWWLLVGREPRWPGVW